MSKSISRLHFITQDVIASRGKYFSSPKEWTMDAYHHSIPFKSSPSIWNVPNAEVKKVFKKAKNETTHLQLATEAINSGINWVQLRMKNDNAEIIKQNAIDIRKICSQNNVTLIINDTAEIAREIGADGVHLGKQDMDIRSARKLLGDKMIIGGSTNSFEDIIKAVDDGADYLGLGPFRFTITKSNLNPVLGLEGFEKIMNEYECANLKIPIIAIGGIRVEDVETLMQLGVYGIAISSAINLSKNKKQAVNNFLSVLNRSFVTT